MNLLRGFRAVKSLGKRNVSIFCIVKLNPVPLPNRVLSSLFHSVKIVKSVSCAGATKCPFSSAAGDDSAYDDTKIRKLRQDPEVRAWMNQLAQNFEHQKIRFSDKGTSQVFPDSRLQIDTVDEKSYRLRSDPEVRPWMNQITDGFETLPSEVLFDQPSRDTKDAHGVNLHSSSDEGVALEATSDVEVEDFGYIEDDDDDFIDSAPEKVQPVSLQRGQYGVFDVEEIVAVLEDENGVDIRVMDIPPEARFVDHMVVVSGKSLRHMRAMAASIEWLYKRKKGKHDPHFKFEGRDCKDWFAMDLGNIVVHIFTPEARKHYDLETLWTLGREFDDPRHYVQDECLKIPEADLIWMEEINNMMHASSHTGQDAETVGGDRSRGDVDHSTNHRSRAKYEESGQ